MTRKATTEAKAEGQPCTLADIPLGTSARITTVGGQGSLRQHFQDMGLIPRLR